MDSATKNIEGMKMNWKLTTKPAYFPWIIQFLDDSQQVIHYASESFSTKDAAMARAKALNEDGNNVVVYFEIAYCENHEEEIANANGI